MTFLLFISFDKNFFNAASSGMYEDFQSDSECLVLGKVAADKFKIDTGSANLGSLHVKSASQHWEENTYSLVAKKPRKKELAIANVNDNNFTSGFSRNDNKIILEIDEFDKFKGIMYSKFTCGGEERLIKEVSKFGNFLSFTYYGKKIPIGACDNIIITNGNGNGNELAFTSYTSQFGLQGLVYAYIFKKTNYRVNVDVLYKLNNLFLAITLASLVVLSIRQFGVLFSVSSFFVFLFSPWVVCFSRNLYWVEFTWFLPAVFAFMTLYCGQRKRLIILLMFYFLAILVKCLCGYEYISTILSFSVIPIVYAYFKADDKNDKIDLLKKFFYLGFLGVLAFVVAVLIHSYVRSGGDVLSGLEYLYEHDIKRRTYGDSSSFSEVYKDSLTVSPLYVIYLYCYKLKVDVIAGISGRLLAVLILISIFIIYKYRADGRMKDYIILMLLFAFPPISWFVLAKAHSYIHTHMNYVLWYFGFVQVLFYIILDVSISEIKCFYVRMKERSLVVYRNLLCKLINDIDDIRENKK